MRAHPKENVVATDMLVLRQEDQVVYKKCVTKLDKM